jgi:hypothetical protein
MTGRLVYVDAQAMRDRLGLRPDDPLPDPGAAVRAVIEAAAIMTASEARWLALDIEHEGDTHAG